MADLSTPIYRCCNRGPNTVIQNEFFVFQCSICGRTVEICPAEKVKIHPRGNFIAPVRAVEAAVVKWNKKERDNGGICIKEV